MLALVYPESDHYVPKADYRDFNEQGKPPDGTTIFMAALDNETEIGTQLGWTRPSRIDFSRADGTVAAQGYRLSFSVLALLCQIFRDPFGGRFARPRRYADVWTRVRPISKGVWPPARTFLAAGLEVSPKGRSSVGLRNPMGSPGTVVAARRTNSGPLARSCQPVKPASSQKSVRQQRIPVARRHLRPARRKTSLLAILLGRRLSLDAEPARLACPHTLHHLNRRSRTKALGRAIRSTRLELRLFEESCGLGEPFISQIDRMPLKLDLGADLVATATPNRATAHKFPLGRL
jgi:hypothetical protein